LSFQVVHEPPPPPAPVEPSAQPNAFDSAQLAAQVQDLKEKLIVVQSRRQEEKSRNKELERYKLLYEQMSEYKNKWSSSQSDLNQQLKQAKKDAKEAQEEKAKMEEELIELQEAVEMATLDKEMAEERCETLQHEVDALKDKVEEVTLDLEILRGEIDKSGIEGVTESAQVKQLEQQNDRLKDALVRLRDLSNQEKAEHQAVQKALEKQTAMVKQLTGQNEKLKQDYEEVEQTVDELKEQVDAALGAEEMVEKLTDRNLELEEEVKEKTELIADLESLREMHEEMEEHHVETELELREEIDMANARTRGAYLKVDAAQEMTADYQQTISQFRDLVRNLQSTIENLQKNSETQSEPRELESQSQAVLTLNMQLKSTEAKAHAKSIEMELRKLDVQQGIDHVRLLKMFIPEFFYHAGGDYDGIQTILLIHRLVYKTDLIAREVTHRFHVGDLAQSDEPLKDDADQLPFAVSLIQSMVTLLRLLNRINRVLECCDVTVYDTVRKLFSDLTAHEKAIDLVVEMLGKEELDDSFAMTPIEKAIGYFKNLVETHFDDQTVSHLDFLLDFVHVFSTNVHCFNSLIRQLKSVSPPSSNFLMLLKDWSAVLFDMQTYCKRVRRRIPQADHEKGFKFGKELVASLLDIADDIEKIARVGCETQIQVTQQMVLLSEHEALTGSQLEEMAKRAAAMVFGLPDAENPTQNVKKLCEKVNAVLVKLAASIQDGEFDVEMKTEQPPEPPYRVRAGVVKGRLCDTEGLGLKLQQKETDILELKKTIKMKANELSEMGVKVSVLEQKLENADKESDQRSDELYKELAKANELVKRKEKEFEVTMDSLQQDIDALEAEKREWKKRHEALSKKSMMAEMTRHGKGSFLAGQRSGQVEGEIGPAQGGFISQVQVVIKDSDTTLAQVI
jgi:dynactin 1